MKIAFLSTFYPYRGGIAQFNAALYRSLEIDHEIKAFNFSLQYPKLLFPGKTQFVTEEDEVDKIPTERVLNSISPVSYRKAASKISAYDPDILIIGYWMPFMAPSLGYIAKKLRKSAKVIAIIHNAIPHEQSVLDKRLNDYFFNRVDSFVALSQSVKNDILKNYNNAKVEVLHHPVYNHFGDSIDKSEARYKLNLKLDKKYLLFFGLIREYKGLDILLETLALLPNDYNLIIAGEVYGSFEKYQKIIDYHDLSKRIHLFDNYIPDKEVGLYFSAADCCVLPYKSATQSGIVAIAKHFKVPVVVSDVGGLGEFIENERSGLLIKTATPTKFSDAIISLFSENKLAEIKTYMENHNNENSWTVFAKRLIGFINQ